MNLELNYECFKNQMIQKWYEEEIHRPDLGMHHVRGVHYIFRFDNGYGASVVKRCGSYGWEKDLWELAVIRFAHNTDEFELDYDTTVTDDVLGWQTNEKILEHLKEIQELIKTE